MRQKKDEKLYFKNWVFNELLNQLIIFFIEFERKIWLLCGQLKIFKEI